MHINNMSLSNAQPSFRIYFKLEQPSNTISPHNRRGAVRNMDETRLTIVDRKVAATEETTIENLLALASHSAICLFCDRKLQRAAKCVEQDRIRYHLPCRSMPGSREPFFDRNYSLCILCSRCARTCNDVRGEGVLCSDPNTYNDHWIIPESLQVKLNKVAGV